MREVLKDFRETHHLRHDVGLEWRDEKPLFLTSTSLVFSQWQTERKLKKMGASPATARIASSALTLGASACLYMAHIARSQRARYRLLERKETARRKPNNASMS